MTDIEIGLIGGSGLYEMEGFEKAEEVRLETPFGAPSDAYVCGSLGGRRVAFLARHGRGHRISPSAINYRANIHGFKQLGAKRLLSASAVGSLKEEIAPLHLVIPDQFIDRTSGRKATFFDEGAVAHVGFAEPFCIELRGQLTDAARGAGATVHDGGTYLCMEGPAFSTRAESHLYRSWGAAIIGMTNLTEAKLAREAELCYATLALATDYDCWHAGHAAVTANLVLDVLRQNAALAQRVLKAAVAVIPDQTTVCKCQRALQNSLVTAPELVPAPSRAKLALLTAKYWPA